MSSPIPKSNDDGQSAQEHCSHPPLLIIPEELDTDKGQEGDCKDDPNLFSTYANVVQLGNNQVTPYVETDSKSVQVQITGENLKIIYTANKDSLNLNKKPKAKKWVNSWELCIPTTDIMSCKIMLYDVNAHLFAILVNVERAGLIVEQLKLTNEDLLPSTTDLDFKLKFRTPIQVEAGIEKLRRILGTKFAQVVEPPPTTAKLLDEPSFFFTYSYAVRMGNRLLSPYGKRDTNCVHVQMTREMLSIKYYANEAEKKQKRAPNLLSFHDDWELMVPMGDVISCKAKFVEDDKNSNAFFIALTEGRSGLIMEQFKVPEFAKTKPWKVKKDKEQEKEIFLSFFTLPQAATSIEDLEHILGPKLVKIDTLTSIFLEGHAEKVKKYDKLGVVNCVELPLLEEGWMDTHYVFKCSRIQLGSFAYTGKNIVVAGRNAHCLVISLQHLNDTEQGRMGQVLLYLKKDTVAMAKLDDTLVVLRVYTTQFDATTTFTTELGVPAGYLAPDSQDESNKYIMLFIQKKTESERDSLMETFKSFFKEKLTTFLY